MPRHALVIADSPSQVAIARRCSRASSYPIPPIVSIGDRSRGGTSHYLAFADWRAGSPRFEVQPIPFGFVRSRPPIQWRAGISATHEMLATYRQEAASGNWVRSAIFSRVKNSARRLFLGGARPMTLLTNRFRRAGIARWSSALGVDPLVGRALAADPAYSCSEPIRRRKSSKSFPAALTSSSDIPINGTSIISPVRRRVSNPYAVTPPLDPINMRPGANSSTE